MMDRLLATIRSRLPSITPAVLNLELFNTVQEFFNYSNAWRYESVTPLTAGVTQYPIFPPSGSELVQIMAAAYKGRPLSQETPSGGGQVNLTGLIEGTYDNFTNETLFTPDVVVAPGNVFQYSIFFPKFITITVPPTADAAQDPIQLLLALRLSVENMAEDSPNDWSIEPWMAETFHETWVDGVLGRLMSQPNKPYSNPQMAMYHMKRFRRFIAQAKQTGEVGYTFNPKRGRYPRGGFIR